MRDLTEATGCVVTVARDDGETKNEREKMEYDSD
jgi:hypothetical protein